MTTTSIFAVVGCHRHRTHELLLQGEDGRWYAWASPSSEPSPVEDKELETEWKIDAANDDPTDSPQA